MHKTLQLRNNNIGYEKERERKKRIVSIEDYFDFASMSIDDKSNS